MMPNTTMTAEEVMQEIVRPLLAAAREDYETVKLEAAAQWAEDEAAGRDPVYRTVLVGFDLELRPGDDDGAMWPNR